MRTGFSGAACLWLAAAFLAILGFGATYSAPADAAYTQSTQFKWQGAPICGGADLKTGKTGKPCGYSKATKLGNARKECPRGSFFDLGTWSCYSCPLGFDRTANDIKGEEACSKAVPKQFLRAKHKGNFASCPSGSIFDPRNGGECWKCPSDYGRTAAPVNEWNACGKVFAKARSAELVATVCPLGTFPDGRNGGECWACPKGYLRSALEVNGSKACYRVEALESAERSQDSICQKDALFDPIDGGSCWTCPKDTVRTVFGVKSTEACESAEIRWNAAKRDAKSLFHIPGGDAVTRAVVAKGTWVETTSRNRSNFAKTNAGKTLAETWELIGTKPQQSGVLIGAVFARVLEIIKTGAKTKDERDLLAYFAKYVQDTRRLTAIQIRDVYKSWKGNNSERMHRSGSPTASMFDIGVAPPDLNKVVSGIMGATGGGLIIGGFALMALHPSAAALHGTAFAALGKAFVPFAVKVATGPPGYAVTYTTTATLTQAAALFAGPMIILTGASIVGAMGIDIMAQNYKAEAKIEDALAISERPVDLKRVLLTEAGEAELLSNWMTMTQATKAPQIPFTLPRNNLNISGTTNILPPAVIDMSMNANPVTQWTAVGGKALDVAIGDDGTVYHVSLGKQAGGYTIYQRSKSAKNWSKIPGSAAVRIAAQGKILWVVDKLGAVSYFNGKSFVRIKNAPKAIDIGASNKGVWIVGADKAVYRYFKVPVAGVVQWQPVGIGNGYRIDIDANELPWVVSADGAVFTIVAKKWKKMPGLAVDVATDTPGIVRAVGKDGIIYQHNSNKSTWFPISKTAGEFTDIAAGGGVVWALGKKNDIFLMSQK